MQDLNPLRTFMPKHDLAFLVGVPYVYHCHHYNLFHDQTIVDVLGEELGTEIRVRIAKQVFGQLLRTLYARLGMSTVAERLQMATDLFAWMGHGRMSFQLEKRGGSARGEFLHYGFSWKQKYGEKIRCLAPLDAVAAGYAAAVAEAAFDLPAGSRTARETHCIAMKHGACEFQIESGSGEPAPSLVTQADVESLMTPSFDGMEEETIRRITLGLRDFLAGVRGDERGLVQAFNIFATLHLSSYYNLTAYEMIRQLESSRPKMLPIGEQLIQEAGRVCVFNTFGNLMLSPEWEGLVGPPSGNVEDTVVSCCAMARGLGFGHWVLHEVEAEKRLVLRCPGGYESPIYLKTYGRSDKARCYIFQGATQAIALLAHQVDWKSRPQLTQAFYTSLFHGSKLDWRIEETRCVSRGDAMCEAVATHE
jgi:hypothetical protein